MHRARRRSNAQAESHAMSVVEEGAVLARYLPTGKLKNSRYFWVSVEEGALCWDKKKNQKPNKTSPLVSVQPEPVLKSAREWFDTIDADGSGELDATELATLYRTARDEKLSKKELAAAMVCDALSLLSHMYPHTQLRRPRGEQEEMDADGSGSVDFAEFEAWWRSTGGDLEKQQEQAFTVVAGDAQLLLVAPSVEAKRTWVNGLTAVLRSLGRLDPGEPEPELEPEAEQVRGKEVAQHDAAEPSTATLIAEIFGLCDTTGSGVIDKGEYKRYLQRIKEWGTGQYTARRYDAQWVAETTSMNCDPAVGITWQAFEGTLYGKYRKPFDVVRQDLVFLKDSGIVDELRASLAAAQTQLAEAHQAAQRSENDARDEATRIRREAIMQQEHARLEERAAARIQREYRDSQKRQTLQAVRKAAAAKAATRNNPTIEERTEGGKTVAKLGHVEAENTNGFRLQLPEGLPPSDVVRGTPRLSPKAYPLVAASRTSELTSPKYGIPNVSAASAQWVDADLYMDSALSTARVACAASRRYPDDEAACTHAIEKLKLAEQSIVAALDRPTEYDERMIQALQKRLRHTRAQVHTLEVRQRQLKEPARELQPTNASHVPAERALSPMSQAAARRQAAKRAGQRFSNSNHVERKACKSPRRGLHAKNKAAKKPQKSRKKRAAVVKENLTKQGDDSSPDSFAHQHAAGCVCRRCVSYSRLSEEDEDDTAASAPILDVVEASASKLSDEWATAREMLTRFEQDSPNCTADLVAASTPQFQHVTELEPEPVLAAGAIISKLQGSPRPASSPSVQRGALQALRAEATAAKIGPKQKADIKVAAIMAVEAETKAAWIAADKAEAEAICIAAGDPGAEAGREGARIAAAEAVAEAARIVVNEAQVAEAARVAAAAEAEAQDARLAEEEAEAAAEAACNAEEEEEEEEAEAARVAAEEGSPALFTDVKQDGFSVDHTTGLSRVEITCPDGSRPGDIILIEGPDGEDIEVIVPDNVSCGETFEFDLEADTVTETHDSGPHFSSRVEITCPDGSGPGDVILIEGPDGEDIEVIVPDNVSCGETFEFDLEADTVTETNDLGCDSPASLELELMTVECPAGSAAGDLLEVTSPRGVIMTVIVPDGVRPGDAFDIEVSA